MASAPRYDGAASLHIYWDLDLDRVLYSSAAAMMGGQGGRNNYTPPSAPSTPPRRPSLGTARCRPHRSRGDHRNGPGRRRDGMAATLGRSGLPLQAARADHRQGAGSRISTQRWRRTGHTVAGCDWTYRPCRPPGHAARILTGADQRRPQARRRRGASVSARPDEVQRIRPPG